MGVNKVIYNNTTLIDLTGDTVTSDTLAEGVVAHDKRGEQIVGTFKGVDVSAEVADYTEKLETQDDILNQIRDTLSARFAVPTTLQNKTVTPTTAEQTITADGGFDGLKTVIVKPIPSDYLIPELQSKTVTPTTSVQTVTPDGAFDGLSEVIVESIPQSYTDGIYQSGYSSGYSSGYDDGKNSVPVVPAVKSIAFADNGYNTSTYENGCHAAITSDGVLLVVVNSGTTTSYENINFEKGTVPSGVSLINQTNLTDTSATNGSAYVAVFSGITGSVDVLLTLQGTNSSEDYIKCRVNITYV